MSNHLAVLLLVSISAWSSCPSRGADNLTIRSNVLFIAVDDLRVELGCYGDSLVKSPNIDRLAARGTLFERAYCQQAVCNPSRASLLTGLRPDTLQVWDLPTHFRRTHPDLVTLPQLFKQQGYFAQDVGKIFHNYRQDEWKGDVVSWSVPAVLHYGTHGNDRPQVSGELPPDQSTLRQTECRDVPDAAYYDGRVAAAAVQALSQIRDRSFFLAVGFWKPHLPFNAPKKYWDLYDRDKIDLPSLREPPPGCPDIALVNRGLSSNRQLTEEQIREARHGHLAAISYLDAQVGKVLDELDRLELSKRTIIVFWSDHGLHVGERGMWGKNTNFELDTRVPLIIASPDHKPNQRTRSLVELLDLYPTLIDLCGLPAPHTFEGTSLRPLLEDPNAEVKQFALSQHPRPKGASDTSMLDNPPEIMGYSIRTDRYRYTEWRDFQTETVRGRELYDHHSDPLEAENLSVEQTTSSLMRELSKLMRQQVGPIPASR